MGQNARRLIDTEHSMQICIEKWKDLLSTPALSAS
jgi:hypothetical protein